MILRLKHAFRYLIAPFGFWCEINHHWYPGRSFSTVRGATIYLYGCSPCFAKDSLSAREETASW